MTRITVVTTITGKKDKLLPQQKYADVDYIAFLDEKITDFLWEVRPACNKFVSPVMNAKIHKILTHKYIDSPYIVWMDGNMTLKQDPHKLIEVMKDCDFAFFKHHSRRDLYKEINVCLKVRRGNPKDLIEQRDAYLKIGFPKNAGLWECGAFVRKNNVHANTQFEKWWIEISRYSDRDQVSFPVVFKDQKWETIPGKVYDPGGPGNDFFEFNNHPKL